MIYLKSMNILCSVILILHSVLVFGLVSDYNNTKNNTNINLNYDVEDGVLKVHHLEPYTYKPTWDDLDSRPLPEWYDKAKVGIFVHWGVYSVPGFGSEWFWNTWKVAGKEENVDFMNKNYKPGFTYQDFAQMFTAEFFEPEKWAKLFADAGAKYVVLTSKHHDGYTLFPSRRSFGWNSVDVGPKRDLVGDLANAVRNEDLVFGLYHSLYEWFNPIYLEDKATLYMNSNYTDTKLWPDLKQIVTDYKPAVIWADGDWDCLDTYWKSREFLAWLYNESPVKDDVVVNDRWGIGSYCEHGDFYNCQDKYNPGRLVAHKWENAFTVDNESWGYRRNIDIANIITLHEMINETVSTVSCGGNVLINVGPTKEGTIAPIFQERLLQFGAWLKINGESIYDTSPWYHQEDSLTTNVWYTCTKTKYNATNPTAVPSDTDVVTAVYAIVLEWPKNNVLKLKDVTQYTKYERLELLGNKEVTLSRKTYDGITMITLPERSTVLSNDAWVLKFTPLAIPSD